MTATGFMTDDAFDNIAPNLAKGIRGMPVIKDHPNWWVLVTADGFHAHKMTLFAQEELRRNKIMLLIGEGDSSHCNQAFDKFVAKHGKSCVRSALDLVTRHNVHGNHVDQWALLLISLSGIRRLMEDPQIVRSSFRAVNMQFSCRVSLENWLIKIKDFLTRGAKFKDEGLITARSLLPEWCTQWPGDRKLGALKIVDEGGGWTDINMLKRLVNFTGMSMNEVTSCQTCWFVETMDPSVEDPSEPPSAPAPRLATFNPNQGLSVFSLKPKGLVGPELFAHMVKFRKRRAEPLHRTYDIGHADHLDLAIGSRVEVHVSRGSAGSSATSCGP